MTSAEILAELRATAPPAPDPLRDRVRTIVASEGSPRRLRLRAPSFAFTTRRVSFALVGALLVAALGAAVVRGLTTGEKSAAPPRQSNFRSTATVESRAKAPLRPATGRAQVHGLPVYGPATGTADQSALQRALPALKSATLAPTELPPAGLRLQNYDVTLGVRVANRAALSKATVEAMRWTRAFGGYVARVSYDTPNAASRGQSVLLLRVPVTKVQQAMQRFAGLGALTSQHVAIQDLQSTVNTQTKRIITLNRRIAAILKALESTQTVDTTARLQAELAARRQELAALTAAKRATVVRGRLSDFYLTLTTKAAKKHVVPPPHKPGRIERRLDAAGGVLAAELAVLAYALVVVAPFALIAVAWLAALRVLRRRTDRRLLAES